MSKSPAYQMYARDWLGSRSVRFMEDYQRGWYIQLLNEAWDSDPQCMLPDDDEILQRIAGVSDLTRVQPAFNDRWMFVRRMFVKHGKYLCNERQMEEYAKQELRRKQASEAGKSSAQKRNDALKAIKDNHFTAGESDPTTVERPLNDRADFVQRKSNPAIAIASASAVALENPPTPRKRRAATPPAAQLYRFCEFVDPYPPDKRLPDAAARAWYFAHVKPGDDALVDELLGNLRAWLVSDQYRQGKGWNIGNYFTKGMCRTRPANNTRADESEWWRGAL